MSEVFLGVIAAAVLVMAAIQVGAIVLGMRAARRVERFVDKIEQDVQPIIGSLQAVTADAARATRLVTEQLAGLAALLAAFRAGGSQESAEAAPPEEEDPLFIG